MEVDKQFSPEFSVEIKIVAGKVQFVIEWDGADAALDSLKPKLPTLLQPLVDLVKMEVDKP